MSTETGAARLPRDKPALSFWQIWNMCFGFLGIQFGFALQNANVSRIFQTLGASVDDIPALWIAAPLTGLLVQPIVGYFSDRTWNGLGRRRPYFLAGAVLSSLALIAFPAVPALWMAAGLLWILDASINISMEPFRAFVGDQLPPQQRARGYSMQGFFIGIGAVVGSALPYLMELQGVANTAAPGQVPDTVRYSFYFGAAAFLGAVLWTVVSTREYSPQELAGFAGAEGTVASDDTPPGAAPGTGLSWAAAGVALLALVYVLDLDRQLFLLGAGCLVWGLARMAHRQGTTGDGLFVSILRDLDHMPQAMRQLAPVQFFSWVALFAMWIYTTPAVTAVHFGATDTSGEAYNAGANWVGVLFGAYNGFAAVAALLIPPMVRVLGLRKAHLLNLWLGAAGFLSFLVIRDPHGLLLSMVGVGFAWASILSLPYALLADSVPAAKMGIYMGLFNFFIVIPQLVAATVLGTVLKVAFGGQPIHALMIGGICFLIAGLLVLRVKVR
ncbi:MAG: MFS transporter [Gammaproteobacteria bacterium]